MPLKTSISLRYAMLVDNNNSGSNTAEPVLAGTPSLEVEYFVGAKSYGLYVIADGS